MKIENFTNRLKTALTPAVRNSFLSAAIALLSVVAVSAQCTLGCNNNVQVSLDNDCEVRVTPSMILEGQGPSSCDYIVIVKGPNGIPLPEPIVNASHIGMTLEVEVRLNGNKCWGTISIEDKLAPTIVCPTDTIFVPCYGTSVVPDPVVVENCDVFTLERVSDVTTDLGCSNRYSAIRVVQFRATDPSGNMSQICRRVVAYQRVNVGQIDFPLNYDGTAGNNAALTCGTLSAPNPGWDNGPGADRANGYPDVSETGSPTTPDGDAIFPDNPLCELNATFSDQRLDICTSSFKILRRWSVLDWCTGDLEERYQIIKVEDNQGPLVTAPQDNFMVPADPYDCTGDYFVEDPIISFDCSPDELISYTVGYLLADATGGAPINGLYIDDNVVTLSNGKYVIRDLPVGQTWVRYTVTDDCGNVSFAFTEVLVKDDVPPVPVCDEFTTVTLTTDGLAQIRALTFDDGSHDNCTSVGFEARRMSSGCGSGTKFGPRVDFCCADVGREVMVELRVWDDANNNGIYGDVIDIIFDQNGSGILGDVVNGEPDFLVECADNFNTCMVTVTVQDKINPVIACPDDITLDCGQDFNDLSLTGDASWADNCGTSTIDRFTTGSLNQCGVGTITRRFVVTDGGGRSASCTQRITVEDSDPFDFNSSADLRYPGNVNLVGCNNQDTDIDNTGAPIINDDACSLVAYTFEDQTFQFVDGACFKILRTFTVIDWCQFNQSNPSAGGTDQHTQIIYLNNTVAPTITFEDVDACIYEDGCSGPVELILEASDDCTPDSELVYRYTIDANNDGTVDFSGNTNNASRTLPTGNHSISWTVEDMCGNTSARTYNVRVRDCKKPTPYCRSEITTVIMPTTGQISIWANDYDLGSTDNCPGTLRFSFDEAGNNSSATFDCTQLGINTIRIWVTDANGNKDFCETRINIQSNGGCNGSTPAGVGGRIANENGEDVLEVMVQLEDMVDNEKKYYQTMTDGKYAFAELNGQYYQVTANRDDYHGNGVSTLDLVLIQRHILGISRLNTAYKIIAADVNNSESVSGADVVAIRKLILGITNEFDNNTSWKFVEAAHVFDINNPWPVVDHIDVNYSSQPQMDHNLIALKVGDVNGSHKVDARSEDDLLDSRSAATTTFAVDNVTLTAGDEVSVPVLAVRAATMYGYQFTLTYDHTVMTYRGLTAGAHDIDADHVYEIEPGVLTVAYDAYNGVSAKADEAMFSLVFDAIANVDLAGHLAITSDVTRAEAYDADLSVEDVELVVRAATVEPFVLMQNSPNPFSSQTFISFVMSETADATLSVFDITGKLLNTYTDQYAKGLNTVTVNANDLGMQGVLYYQLESQGYTATKKMILISK